MTSTETAQTFTPDQKRIYREDTVGFVSDLDQVTGIYNVIEIGRILPGDAVAYTGVYVLRRWTDDEYVTHLMYRIDDREQLIWAFSSGHYFHVADYDSRIDAINAASVDLAER